MMKFFSFILLVLSVSSCSYLTKKFESLTETKEEAAKRTSVVVKNNYCAPESKIQYISEDETLLKFYKNLNPTIFENKNISFVQKAIMLSLIEMNRRPDLVSPSARLQVYLKLNGKNHYFDFRPKKLEDDTKMSYLKGLDLLTQKFIPGNNLTSIANSLDNLVPIAMNVSLEFENFLRDNKGAIVKNETLINHFIKGDETITKYETFNRLSFKSILQQYQNPLYANNSDYEFDVNGLNANKSQKPNFAANCNYDLQKEGPQRDDLVNSELRKSHTIGLSDGDDYFLAVASSTLFRPFTTLPKMGYFMKARPSPLPLPVCEFIGLDQEVVLFSSDGRNPVQHLQHLLSYGVDQVNSTYALNELLNFSRHLFLNNPDRILYESKRGRKSQLDFFLSMNFPIYHVESLGNVFGHASFKADKKIINGLHIDDRSQTRLWCK